MCSLLVAVLAGLGGAAPDGLLVVVGDVEVPDADRPVWTDGGAWLAQRGLEAPRVPHSARSSLDLLIEAKALFESDPQLERSLQRVEQALEGLPSAIPLEEADEAGRLLAFAAHVRVVAGLSLHEPLAALAARVPDAELGTAHVPPQVVTAFDALRGKSALPAAPEGCRWQIEETLLGRPSRAHARCGPLRSWSHPADAPHVASWEIGLRVDGRALRVPTAVEASALAASADVPWVAVVEGRADGALTLTRHRGQTAVKSRVAPAELALALGVAEEGLTPLAVATPVAESGRLPWWTWTLLGVGTAALIGGGVVNALAVQNREDNINAGRNTLSEEEVSVPTFATLYGVGGAALLSGLVLAIVQSDGEPREN